MKKVKFRNITRLVVLLCVLFFSLKVDASIPNIYQKQDTTVQDTLKISPYIQDRYGDPLFNFQTNSPFFLKKPSSIGLDVELDTTGNYYQISEPLGNTFYRTPSLVPFDEYKKYRFKKDTKSYWQSLSLQQDGQSNLPGDDNNRLIPPIKLGPIAYRLFGGDVIDIRTTGNIVLDFGGLWQRVDNPQVPVRQQRNGGFNFDQQISMNLQGNVGEKLAISINADTKNTFQFDQQYNLSYTAFDEDIIQDVQVGNVSFPVTNSLISGAQNLFGVYTRLRFGKLYINAVMSSQRGRKQTIVVKNGGQSREFNIRAHEYEDNKHYFLSQFFRENYESALRNIPTVVSPIKVTRVKVFVTNRKNDTQTLRNIVGLIDLGEADPHNNNLVVQEGNPSRNSSNNLYDLVTQLSRNPDEIGNLMINTLGFENGSDFEVLRASRELQPSEYELNADLGYVSLKTPLRNDEVMAVAFEYTYNGRKYQVGELNEDYADLEDEDIVYLKLLSPSTIRTDLPTWDLMMKNIYSLESTQVARENFQLRIIYRDDLTGIDNPNLHEGERTANIPLVQLLGLDRLNPNNDPVFDSGGDPLGDGNFDYLPGITIDPNNGRIIFPVLEPFGQTLGSYFNEDELELYSKYVFEGLYNGTKADAELNTAKNKFWLSGSTQTGGSSDINLPAINVSENSVQVWAGNSMLSEGSDYTVDYQFGRVKILNQGVLQSSKEIRIDYEQADLFSFQTRNMLGVDLEYNLSKDVRFTTTLMNLGERPVISRVNIGSEPVRNTLWGATADYKAGSRFLTKMIDAIPFVSTKEQSNVAISAEFAQLIPGSPKLLGKNGRAYIDSFEDAENSYSIGRSPTEWVLGSTPVTIKDQYFNPNDPLSYNYKRARLAWYNIDQVFYSDGGISRFRRPDNITSEELQNHYVRLIPFNEVFPNKQASNVNQNEISFDLAYYPDERGPYNYSTDLRADGKLNRPEESFGAITKAITSNVDFDNINVQYIEFWMMDPFSDVVRDEQNDTGGELYFNLGNISEDLIPDGRQFFENGLEEDTTRLASTPWGFAPTEQYLTDAFDAVDGARDYQDVGFDGLNNELEQSRFEEYLNSLPAVLSPEVLEEIRNDPSGDDFEYFLSDRADAEDWGVLERYKYFNGPDGNSPEINGGADFTPSSTNYPDNEDLNQDNTLSELDNYFQYRVDLRPNTLDEEHPYVVDKVIGTAPETGKQVNWYQFRIPIRGDAVEKIGNIESFKSIRFMRMFLTDWQQPVVLRLVQFQLVGAQWRPYLGDLREPGLGEPQEPYDSGFRVSTVNVEENGQFDGENTPYVLPPDVGRDQDATSLVARQLNEQSLQLCVDDLRDGDSRAVYKNYNYDLVNYERLKMEVHAQTRDLNAEDGDMRAFIRVGTDFIENYYEIEVPLEFTPNPSTTPDQIWPASNRIDIAMEELYRIKALRNQEGASVFLPFPSEDVLNVNDQYRVTVVGNPDLSNVQTLMLGIRNPETDDQQPHATCVWLNELRVTDFNNQPGWAANLSFNTKLADFADIRGGLRYSSVGFGGIQDRVSERSRTEELSYDISSNINLDKIFLNKVGISLPLFVSYEKSTSTPYFNPLDPDVPLDIALDAINDEPARSDYRSLVRDVYEAKSINLMNVRKRKMRKDAKSHLWDIENIALSASYSDSYRRGANIHEQVMRRWELGASYSYQSSMKPIKPFEKVEGLESPWLALIKNINFNPMPNSINVRGGLRRSFDKTQFRNKDLTTDNIAPNFQKSFMFNRNYALNWALTESLQFDYSADANAIIDEPEGDINTQVKQDSIWTNIRNLGRMKLFNQRVNATYRLPFDKIPLTTWLNGDIRYSANYTWRAASIGQEDLFGNTIQNNNNIGFNGKLDLNKIYNAIPFLKRINNVSGSSQNRSRTRSSGNALGSRSRSRNNKPKLDPDHPLMIKKTKLEKKVAKIDKKINKLKGKINPKPKEDNKSSESKNSEKPNNEEPKKPKKEKEISLPDSTRIKKWEGKISKLEEKKKGFSEQIATVDKDIEEKAKAGKEGEKKNVGREVIKGLARAVMLVKDLNFSYSENNSTTLPGFTQRPDFLGFDSNWDSPGLPFLLGSQDPNIRFTAARNGWLVQNDSTFNNFLQTSNKQLSINTSLQPIKGLKIDLQAKRSVNSSYSEVFRYQPDIVGEIPFETQSPSRNGSYSISFISFPTAFTKDDNLNNSSTFTKFEENVNTIQDRLSAENPNGNYESSAQDVLIPAFIAAYSGRSADNIKTTAFPKIPLPNWNISFSGLSELPGIKEIFKSFTLNHRYSSEYTVGNFNSALLYGPEFIGLDRSLYNTPFSQVDPETGILVPVYLTNQVSIREQFAPFIGVSVRTQNDWQVNLNINRNRNVMLNLTNAQVTELKNSDFSLDIGYTKAGVRLPFKIRGERKTLKNDLTFRLNCTIRDTKTVQRKVGEDATVTAGNLNVQLKPTLSYMINNRADFQFYFERVINDPLVSNSFRRTSTAFGFRLRYGLMQ